jgi:uncharacterized Tic20 family protein
LTTAAAADTTGIILFKTTLELWVLLRFVAVFAGVSLERRGCAAAALALPCFFFFLSVLADFLLALRSFFFVALLEPSSEEKN